MKTGKTYQHLAMAIDSRINCLAKPTYSADWADRHEMTILEIVKLAMPSGSGFDCGTKIDLERSTGNKLVFTTSYHHMNDNGMYDGWTSHTVTVKPSLVFGFDLTVSGRDRNDIKDYIAECFQSALNAIVEHSYDAETDKSTFTIKQD